MKEPFDIWWDENMTGFGVSDELRKLLSKAFAGGMEASSGMKSVTVKPMSYTALRNHIAEGGFDPYSIGDPEFVAVWPLPPVMVKEHIHRATPATSVHSSPTEKLRSFMGDIKWGDAKEPEPIVPSTTTYDPSSDTWKTRTGSAYYVGGGGGGGLGGGVLTTSTVGAEKWHTTEMYDDMSREERDREMTRIADLMRKKIDESVLDKVRESVRMTTGGMATRPVEYKLAEHQNEHIIAHRNFVEAMSSHKDKILSEKQRVVLAKKKKRLKDKAVADRIDELAKIFEDKNERA